MQFPACAPTHTCNFTSPEVSETLHVFQDLIHSQTDIKKLVLNAAIKSCSLDPVPTRLLKKCLDSILPFLKVIVNRSVMLSYFPKECKKTHCVPPDKKAWIGP